MRSRWQAWSLVFCIVAILAGAVFLLLGGDRLQRNVTPDFADIFDVDERKATFFRWLAPVVREENDRLRELRRQLAALSHAVDSGQPLRRADRARLQALADYYQVPLETGDEATLLAELRRRVDTVPIRLVLAQAAVESAWGTSRFAREANNYFGIWTWRGHGLVPEQRDDGRNHRVAMYPDAAASVRAYLYTLGTGAAYAGLREQRARAREAGRRPSAMELTGGLEPYSERGAAYVAEIREMLRVNAQLLDDTLQGI